MSRSVSEYRFGLGDGLPIALGYIPVSFTFGLMAASLGMDPLLAVIMSITNLTSAGQFAGARLMIEHAKYYEIIITVFIINLRYGLMSLGISQKIEDGLPLWKKAVIAFGITDETYAVASLEENTITYKYMLGLITLPFFGWTIGTMMGAYVDALLPKSISSASGIALYGMFIALMIPAAKASKTLLLVILVASGISVILNYIPLFSFLSSGWCVILSSVSGALIMTLISPMEEQDEH